LSFCSRHLTSVACRQQKIVRDYGGIFSPEEAQTEGCGIDPVLFGLVLVCSVAIGHVTPPVALTLYIGSGISGVPVSQLLRPLMPFLGILVGWTLIVAYIPWITLALPSLLR